MSMKNDQARTTLLMGCAGALLCVLGGCAVSGEQVAGVQPRGQVAKAMAGQNTTAPAGVDTDHTPESAAMAAPGIPSSATASVRGNPMPNWVVAEAERLVAGGAPLGTALPVGPAIARADLATRFRASEEGTTLTDGMDGLQRASFAEEGADFDPRISRDGLSLVFASTQHRPTSDIYVKQVGSRTVTQLTADPANDVMPALSPDGKKIAFASDRSGAWKIYMMSASGGQAVQLTSDPSHDLHPSWSPDAKRLVFCRLGQMSGRWELWVVETDRPSSAEFIGFGMFPEWCSVAGTGAAGNDKIAFQRGRERGDRAFSLWTIDYKPGSSGNLTEIVASRGSAAINPTWSPDGLWLAYSVIPVGHESGKRAASPASAAAEPARADLWITSIDGGARVNLSSGRFANVMPTWGPENKVYFVSNRNGLDNIWAVGTSKALAAASATGNSVASSAQPSASPAAAKAADAIPSNSSTEGLATVPTQP